MRIAKANFGTLPLSRLRMIQFSMGMLFLYLLFISLEIPFVFTTGSGSDDGSMGLFTDALPKHVLLGMEAEHLGAVSRPFWGSSVTSLHPLKFSWTPERRMREFKRLSGLFFNESMLGDMDGPKDEFSVLDRRAKQAWVVGRKVWEELRSTEIRTQ
ncbi:hypothetical protein ACOSP7_018162 [Xanthoceras sorbifolium]